MAEQIDDDIILEVKDLYLNFETEEGTVRALDGISFDVRRDEAVGIVGESGCGKTVTSHAIMRINPKNAVIPQGEIQFTYTVYTPKSDDVPDEPMRGLSERELKKDYDIERVKVNLLDLGKEEMRRMRGKKLALTFQDPMSSLNPVFTIADQMIDVIKEHIDCTVEEAREIAIIEMAKVGIPDPAQRIDDYPHMFSGGMRQRIILARAFALEPELLITDEPTTALDVTIQAQVLEIIKNLRKEYGMSLVIITHDLGVVAETTDRVHVFYGGTVVESGVTPTVFGNPQHPYTKALISSIPKLSEYRSELDVIPGNVPQLINPPDGCRFHPRCKYAQDKCKTEKPYLEEEDDGRLVSCHFTKEIASGEIQPKVFTKTIETTS